MFTQGFSYLVYGVSWEGIGSYTPLHSTLHGICLPCTTHVHRHDGDNQIKIMGISRELTSQSNVFGPYVVTLLD